MQFSSRLLVFVTLFVLCLTDTDIHNLTLAASKCGGKEKASTLLDVSKDLINKAKDAYPICVEDDLNCGQKEKSFAFLDVAMNVISEVKKRYPTCPETECPKEVERPMDCSDILRSGKNESGVYTIWPRSRILNNMSLTVYCDMDTEGGGWTVIQRRGNFSTPKDYFDKDWESYKKGFGDVTEEFWIGNDNIFAISNQANYTIRFDLKDAEGESGYAEYSTFWIEDEVSNYTLHIKGYNGNIGDSMSEQNNKNFYTRDRNKASTCSYPPPLWYNGCNPYANPNGIYQPGVGSSLDGGMRWYYWKKNHLGLSRMEMKLRF